MELPRTTAENKAALANSGNGGRPAPQARTDDFEKAQDIARRYRCEFIDLHNFQLHHDLFKKIPVDLMFRYNFVPLDETQDGSVCIKFRIDGVLTQAMPPIAKEHHTTIISRIKVMSELDISERRVPQDGRFRVKYGQPERPIDFRVSIMPSIHGEDAVLRVLDKESM